MFTKTLVRLAHHGNFLFFFAIAIRNTSCSVKAARGISMMQPVALLESQNCRAAGRVCLLSVLVFTITAASWGQTPRSDLPSGKGMQHWSKYVNRKYGFSFRYPNQYALEQRTDDNRSTLAQPWQELKALQPGAVLAAVVTVPRDVYPETTFVGGNLKFVVNPVVTADTCQSFVVPADEAYTSGRVSIRGVQFYWRQRGSAAGGTGYLQREYAGFSNGVCVEYFAEVVAGSNPDADPRIKEASPTTIMLTFEKIALSLQIWRKGKSGGKEGLPVIRSFTVEPVFVPHIQNVVRVSWEISGARANNIFLRVNCHGLPDLNPLPDIDSSTGATSDLYSRPTLWKLESIFSCGSFAPISPQSGSFRLQVENGPVSFTLFVFNLDYVTRP